MRLTTIQRKAAIAWCPIPEYSNYLAAGSLAGSLEADFSAQSKVELYNVVNFANKTKEAEPLGFSLSTDRFTQLCWGNPAAQEYPMGVIAGAMMDGTIELHNPEVVLKHEQTEEVKPLATFEKHTKAVRGLEFNPKSTNLLASAGEDSQLYIFNLKNPTTPTLYTLGGKNPHQGQVISALGWNRIFEYILATTSQQGVSVIWDLKQKKPLVGFSNQSRLRRYSSIAWSPSDATQLAVAADDDDAPVIELWDVRQTHAPVKTLQGHNKGILSLSWCPDDSNLLLSSSKDGRTIIWNPHTSEILGELSSSASWMYDVKWSNRPSVLSTSSYDGRINVYSLQDSSAEADAESEEPNALGIKTKPVQTSNKSVFKTAPRWLQRPVGASFGFGRLVSFNQQSKSVTISNVVTEPEFATRSEELENVLKTGAFEEYCEKKAAAATTENDRSIWNTMKVLFKQGAEKQDKILQALGFDKSNISNSLEEQFNNATQEENAEDEERPKVNQQKVDELIRSSITVANFEDAVNICLKAGRMDDALVIAAWGGPQLWEKTRQEYLNKQKRPAMKVIAKILTNKLEDIIAEADLANWKETLAVLATFAKEHFTPLCQRLGDRLETESKDMPAATICHMLSGNIEKVVTFWLEDLKAKDATDNEALVNFMEKVVVFQQSKPSQQPLSVELVEKYTDYAVLLSSQGLLSAALRYLNLTLTASGSLPKATAELRHRIFNALEKPFGPVPQQPWAQARISAAPRQEQPKQSQPLRPAPTMPVGAPWGQPGTFPVPQPTPSRPGAPTMPAGVMPPGMPAPTGVMPPTMPTFTPQPSTPSFVPSPVPQPAKVGTPGMYEPPVPSFGLPPVAPTAATNPIGLPPVPFTPAPAPTTGAFQPVGLPPSTEPAPVPTQPMIPPEATTKRPEPTPAPAPRREEPKKAAATDAVVDTSKLEGDAQTIASVLQAAFDKAFGGNLGSTEQTKKKLTRKDLNVLLTQLNENKVPEALLKLVLEFSMNLEKRDFAAADKDLKKMSSGFLEESKSYFKGLKFLQQTLKG